MNGQTMPREASNPWGQEFGSALSMHGYDGWSFHDNEPLLEGEEIKDWRPPDWAKVTTAGERR